MRYIEGWGGCVCPTSLWALTQPPWQEQGTDSHCRITERGVSNQLPRLPYWRLLGKSRVSAPTPLGCAAERGGKEGERRRANKPCFQSPQSILLLLDILIPGVSCGTGYPRMCHLFKSHCSWVKVETRATAGPYWHYLGRRIALSGSPGQGTDQLPMWSCQHRGVREWKHCQLLPSTGQISFPLSPADTTLWGPGTMLPASTQVEDKRGIFPLVVSIWLE